jgi:hypothetical protein
MRCGYKYKTDVLSLDPKRIMGRSLLLSAPSKSERHKSGQKLRILPKVILWQVMTTTMPQLTKPDVEISKLNPFPLPHTGLATLKLSKHSTL